MTPRFRMVAGPNGSGKTSLVARLAGDYAVNFYTMLNADDVFAHVKKDRVFSAPMPIDGDRLVAYASASQYADGEKRRFISGEIYVEGDCVRFGSAASINSYTVALLVNFLQDECIDRRISFSQETVFSHPSKVAALKKARISGFRTYFYYVATIDPAINTARVLERYVQGGHNVPAEKISARYGRSLQLAVQALPYLSRAYFFDNSGRDMKYLASYSDETGLYVQTDVNDFPNWFKPIVCAADNAMAAKGKSMT